MKWLGGMKTSCTPREITPELERSGYHRFMSFQGNSIDGYCEPLDIQVKLMNCPVLKWPLLVEIEKVAKTEEEAKEYEHYLQQLCPQLQLQQRLVSEEPPSMLYTQVFAHDSGRD